MDLLIGWSMNEWMVIGCVEWKYGVWCNAISEVAFI